MIGGRGGYGGVWDRMGAWGKIIHCGGDFMEVIIEGKGGSAAPPCGSIKRDSLLGCPRPRLVESDTSWRTFLLGQNSMGLTCARKKWRAMLGFERASLLAASHQHAVYNRLVSFLDIRLLS